METCIFRKVYLVQRILCENQRKLTSNKLEVFNTETVRIICGMNGKIICRIIKTEPKLLTQGHLFNAQFVNTKYHWHYQ